FITGREPAAKIFGLTALGRKRALRRTARNNNYHRVKRVSISDCWSFGLAAVLERAGNVALTDLKGGAVLAANQLLPCQFSSDAGLDGIRRNAGAFKDLRKLGGGDVLPSSHAFEGAGDLGIPDIETIGLGAGDLDAIIDQIVDDLLAGRSFVTRTAF